MFVVLAVLIDFNYVSLRAAERVCRPTKLVGWADLADMTDQDQLAHATAKKNCSKYFKRSPCLIEFILRSEGVYRAICGEASK